MSRANREFEKVATQRMTADELITRSDLEKFREEMLEGFRQLLEAHIFPKEKNWLKSFQVRKRLGISSNTLQELRDSGKLPYSKVGGLFYYSQDDIDKMLEERMKIG
ncbi:MAG TPA: helix-turn-helix domain-containing protein [Chitinophaga sp.]|uniref:helix-turn-helix domain-containing protein n=1 Tax=Chitinophaga sp. TaxID=1869181 RepID=UPI002B87E13F|nr:helix-turn-helix domain-containing protein [Chitinophaga sp.]HVI49294.1 helix-turn-helix domain-containing protein [Chitinophaga sp.]